VAMDVPVKFHKCMWKYSRLIKICQKKFKMAATTKVRYHDCYLVTVDHPRSLLSDWKSVLKFHVNCVNTV